MIEKSFDKANNQTTSAQVAASALYSAFEELQDMVGCFFVFQLMRESPVNTQKPVIDLRVSIQLAQSLFESACKESLED